MRPVHSRPSRRLLQVAAAMYQPFDRKAPIAVSTSPKPDTEQQQLDLHQAERKDTTISPK